MKRTLLKAIKITPSMDWTYDEIGRITEEKCRRKNESEMIEGANEHHVDGYSESLQLDSFNDLFRPNQYRRSRYSCFYLFKNSLLCIFTGPLYRSLNMSWSNERTEIRAINQTRKVQRESIRTWW